MCQREQQEELMRDSKTEKKIDRSLEAQYHKENPAPTTNIGIIQTVGLKSKS